VGDRRAVASEYERLKLLHGVAFFAELRRHQALELLQRHDAARRRRQRLALQQILKRLELVGQQPTNYLVTGEQILELHASP